MRDVLLPHTDAGALAQVIGVLAMAALLTAMVRRERSLVLLTLGVSSVLLGLMGVRALH